MSLAEQETASPSARLQNTIHPGVQRRKSRWGHRMAYWTQNREFAHFQNENMLDIRITRGWLNLMRREPLDRRITLRPRPSDWIEFKITNRGDMDAAFKLAKLALRNNRSASI
ncbi:MAG TPA: luciferase family protein [Candidatus Bathyarchaeia archaeon]|nr:luciferase family protein [Candidatus Bathyarchaeia archaeon]